MTTLCVECEFYDGPEKHRSFLKRTTLRKCLSKKAPYSDMVTGWKAPYQINKGKCPYFREIYVPTATC